jgi:hypothetical protein
MRVRLSFSRHLSDLGWTFPTAWMAQSDSLMQREVYDRLKDAFAQLSSEYNGTEDVCRRARAFRGYKAG